jgi:hypothetical protein
LVKCPIRRTATDRKQQRFGNIVDASRNSVSGWL